MYFLFGSVGWIATASALQPAAGYRNKNRPELLKLKSLNSKCWTATLASSPPAQCLLRGLGAWCSGGVGPRGGSGGRAACGVGNPFPCQMNETIDLFDLWAHITEAKTLPWSTTAHVCKLVSGDDGHLPTGTYANCATLLGQGALALDIIHSVWPEMSSSEETHGAGGSSAIPWSISNEKMSNFWAWICFLKLFFLLCAYNGTPRQKISGNVLAMFSIL